MRILVLFIAIGFWSSLVKAQVIKGKLFDYEGNEPYSYVNVIADSKFDFIANRALDWCISDTNGVFLLDSLDTQDNIHLIFQSVSTEALIIENIPNDNDTLDLGNIYLFLGSYHWDGECTKKYLWGLIKWTKGCSGEVTGIIKQNVDKDTLVIDYPKGHEIKKFRIREKALIIDYGDLKNK